LISEFLSPHFNRRTDTWGGSEANRVRILKEIAIEVKRATDLPVSVKINGHDGIKGGSTPELVGRYARMLPEIDLFEISCGFADGSKTIRCSNRNTSDENATGFAYKEAYTAEYTRIIREIAPSANLACAGGHRDFENMEKLVGSGVVDLISMSRPFIRQPHIIRDFQDALTTKCACENCGGCMLQTRVKGTGVYCVKAKGK
jgi:2,4-dienoyl-CoA reductase-like NADH-dependent reductase (Old Yellow Enzyme family)